MYFNHIHLCFYFNILLHFCKLDFLKGYFFLTYAVSADERKSERAIKSAWTVEIVGRREGENLLPVFQIGIQSAYSDSVADTDLQIRGRGGGGNQTHPEIRWSGVKKFGGAFSHQFGLKIRGSPDAPGSSPRSATATAPYLVPKCQNVKRCVVILSINVVTDVHVWYRHLSFNCLSINC